MVSWDVRILAQSAFICIFPKYGSWLKFCISLHVVTRFIVSWDVRILAQSAFICIFPKYGIWLKFCISLHVVTRFIVSWDVRILAHSAFICIFPKYGIWWKFCLSLRVFHSFLGRADPRTFCRHLCLHKLCHACHMLPTYSYFILCSASHCLTFDHTLPKR